MAKLRTEKIKMDGSVKGELEFKYDINVNKDGTFTTTIPQNIVELFDAAQIDLSRNQLRRKGYFTSDTIDGLTKQVLKCCEEYLSRKMISHEIVIKYCIQTTCSYCLDIKGEVVPNGSNEWTKTKDGSYHWKQGTENQHANEHHPFGINIYAKPFHKREFKYKSGKIKQEYEHFSAFGSSETKKNQHYLKWLEGISSICPPEHGKIMEITYSEDVAKVFVDMLKGICMINEKIKDLITPDKIQLIADSKLKLLV